MEKSQNKDWPSGVKKTKQREAVLSVLKSAEKPLSAMQICSEIENSGEAAWLSTVYRILELFVEKGLVIKISVQNSDVAIYELNRFQHKHYAVCLSCHKIITMENCPMEKFIPQIQESEFKVTGHNLEIYGYCKECSEKLKI